MSIKYKLNKTFASFILLFIIFVSIINPPIIANAYVTYYIQMTIDTDNWIFLGGVIKDNGSQATDSKGLLEPKRISKNELDKMASNSESNSSAANLINNLSLDEERIPQASLTDQNLVLSFPGEKTGSLWWKNSAQMI